MITKKILMSIIMCLIIIIFAQYISAQYKMTPVECVYVLDENEYRENNKGANDPNNVAPDWIFGYNENNPDVFNYNLNPWRETEQKGIFLKITNLNTDANRNVVGESCSFPPCYFPTPLYKYESFQPEKEYYNNKGNYDPTAVEPTPYNNKVKTPMIDLTGVSQKWLHIRCIHKVGNFKIFPDYYYIFGAKTDLGGGIYGTHDFGLDTQGAFTNIPDMLEYSDKYNDLKDPITIYRLNFQDVDAKTPYYVDNIINEDEHSYDKIFSEGIGFFENTKPIFKGRIELKDTLPSGIISSYTYFRENAQTDIYSPGISNLFYLKTPNQVKLRPIITRATFQQIRKDENGVENIIQTYVPNSETESEKERFLISPKDKIKATYLLKNEFGVEIKDINFRHGIFSQRTFTGGVGDYETTFLCKYGSVDSTSVCDGITTNKVLSGSYPSSKNCGTCKIDNCDRFCDNFGTDVATVPKPLNFAPADDIDNKDEIVIEDTFTIPDRNFYYPALYSYADIYYEEGSRTSYTNAIGYDDKKYLGFNAYDPRIDFDEAKNVPVLIMKINLFNPTYNPNQKIIPYPPDYKLKFYIYDKDKITGYDESDLIQEVTLDNEQLIKDDSPASIPSFGEGLVKYPDDRKKATEYSQLPYQFNALLWTNKFISPNYLVATTSIRTNDIDENEIGSIGVKPIINPGKIFYFKDKDIDGNEDNTLDLIKGIKEEDTLIFTVFNPSFDRRILIFTRKKFNNNLDNDVKLSIYEGVTALSEIDMGDKIQYNGGLFKSVDRKTFAISAKGLYSSWPQTTISTKFTLNVELIPLSLFNSLKASPSINLNIIGTGDGGGNGGGGCYNQNDFKQSGLVYLPGENKLDFTYWSIFSDSSLYDKPYDIIFKLFKLDTSDPLHVVKIPIREYTIKGKHKVLPGTNPLSEIWDGLDNLEDGDYYAEAEVNPVDETTGARKITETCESGSNIAKENFDISSIDPSKSCQDYTGLDSCHENLCVWDIDGTAYSRDSQGAIPDYIYGYARINIDNDKNCVDCNTKNSCKDYKNYEACETDDPCGLADNLCQPGSNCKCIWDEKTSSNPLTYECKTVVDNCVYKNEPETETRCDEANTWEKLFNVDIEATRKFWKERLGMDDVEVTNEKIETKCKPISSFGTCAKLSYFNKYNFIIAIIFIIVFYFILLKNKRFKFLLALNKI